MGNKSSKILAGASGYSFKEWKGNFYPDKIKPEDRAMAAKIATRIREMSRSPGVDGFEQCAVAAREQGTKTELVLPEIRVVGNGFVSLMAYQAKGYAYIAP